MAEKSVAASRKGNWLIFKWTGVTESDTFQPVRINHNVSDVLVEVSGTFGGATVNIKGYLEDSTAAVNIKNPGGADIVITAAGGDSIRDVYPWVQPSHSGGTGENINVIIYCKVAK